MKQLKQQSAWAALRHGMFRAVWIATIASNIGTWMQDMGNAWLMTSLSPSPLLVSMVQAAESLPLFLLALPAGALVDVLDRRRVLIVSSLWMCAAAPGIGCLTLCGLERPSTRLDLKFAGIDYGDQQIGYADLHAQRTTMNTMLASQGIDARTRQAQLRHTDPRLTEVTYFDKLMFVKPQALALNQAAAIPGISAAKQPAINDQNGNAGGELA